MTRRNGDLTVNPLRLLTVLKRIKNKSRSYYRMFPNVPENTTRHTVITYYEIPHMRIA